MGGVSQFLTWFGYEAWFARVVLCGILNAVAGRAVRPSHQSYAG